MKEKSRFSLSSIPRSRFNVIDLLKIVGRDAARGYLFSDVDMSWAQELRAKLAEKGENITVTAILLKAIARAQRLYPQSLQGYLPFNMRVNYHEIVAGFTVEKVVDSDPAVFFGCIEGPERKTLVQIASELRDYGVGKISEVPTLKMQDTFSKVPVLLRKIFFLLANFFPQLRLSFNSATFGLSTLGKYGVVTAFGPAICACTFGIGTIEDRPVVRRGEIIVKPVLTIALSYDQRLIDTIPAAMFMRDIKELLEGKLEDYLELGFGEAELQTAN